MKGKNMEIRSLSNTPTEVVHRTFLRAFSDYEVQLDLPIEKFIQMIKNNDLNFAYSVGAFERDELIGFIMGGYRQIDGLACCYDGGTGILPEYRQKGIGKKLVSAWLDRLQKMAVDRVILEVLENNTPAIELYKKAGFQIERTFSCCHYEGAAIQSSDHPYTLLDDIQTYIPLDCAPLLAFPPSWQNAKPAVVNDLESFAYAAVVESGQVVGYGLVHKVSGHIPQIGIRSDYSDKGLEAIILAELAQRTESRTFTYLNIEQGSSLERSLVGLGFERFIGQYEMVKKL
jgi:ribosomal protein S18 acetylase RimI-like enzyme